MHSSNGVHCFHWLLAMHSLTTDRADECLQQQENIQLQSWSRSSSESEMEHMHVDDKGGMCVCFQSSFPGNCLYQAATILYSYIANSLVCNLKWVHKLIQFSRCHTRENSETWSGLYSFQSNMAARMLTTLEMQLWPLIVIQLRMHDYVYASSHVKELS